MDTVFLVIRAAAYDVPAYVISVQPGLEAAKAVFEEPRFGDEIEEWTIGPESVAIHSWMFRTPGWDQDR